MGDEVDISIYFGSTQVPSWRIAHERIGIAPGRWIDRLVVVSPPIGRGDGSVEVYIVADNQQSASFTVGVAFSEVDPFPIEQHSILMSAGGMLAPSDLNDPSNLEETEYISDSSLGGVYGTVIPQSQSALGVPSTVPQWVFSRAREGLEGIPMTATFVRFPSLLLTHS